MSKFIEVTEKGKKIVICVGVGMDIIPPNEYFDQVNIMDHNIGRNIFADESYEEIKAILGVVNG